MSEAKQPMQDTPYEATLKVEIARLKYVLHTLSITQASKRRMQAMARRALQEGESNE